MFLGGLPITSAQQIASLLADVDTSKVFVACSGSFRLERTVLQTAPEARVFGNDVSLYSCAIGRWLAGEPVEYRFTGPLAPLEEIMAAAAGAPHEAQMRAAGLLVALDVSQYGKGKRNLYKDAHWRHLTSDLVGRLAHAMAKLGAAFPERYRLAGFHGGDWLEQIDRAIDEKATIASFPPFYKGGYESLYRWIEEHAEWDAPTYAVFDPKNLQQVVDKITSSGVDYVLVSNQRLERPEPRARFTAANRTEHWTYAGKGEARFTRAKTSGKPFTYKPLDLAKVTKDSKIEIRRVDGPTAMYIRSIYLKKTIAPVAGVHNFFVYIDGMLTGVMVYAPNKFPVRADSIYLLSDVSVSREAKVSKLIARLASNAVILDNMAAKTLTPLGYVLTTAFSDHPVSMKYRGLFELLSRREAEGGFQLQYGSDARRETPQDAFSWWWSTYVNQDSGQAAGRQSGRGQSGGGRGRR